MDNNTLQKEIENYQKSNKMTKDLNDKITDIVEKLIVKQGYFKRDDADELFQIGWLEIFSKLHKIKIDQTKGNAFSFLYTIALRGIWYRMRREAIQNEKLVNYVQTKLEENKKIFR